jgi:glycosyltransferase involved in cell wall biosynthesis
MLLVIIKNVKLIISSVDLNFKKNFFYLVRPSELSSLWFKNRKKNSTTPVKLLYLGRFRKEKGINDFVKLISSSDLNFELQVYGLNYLSKFKSNSKIKYSHQIIEPKKIIKAYDDCNIFILPSYTESAPKVIWESLARLRPVIVFEEISHVAKNKIGVYVCKRNLDDLIKTIESIMRNYILIQKSISKNKFPTKKQFQQELINILN